ncbi:hypothetical protein WG922_05545 [Ramlibacter sp. AN1015]|uniref:hypothetical protein n=1 Tax=Ramlibacter sp. AN1015 TaxID=3133428 RepID=UPI0030C40737
MSQLSQPSGRPPLVPPAPPIVAAGATEVEVSSRWIVRTLASITAILLALHLAVVWSYHTGVSFPLRARLYMDAEANLPTFFSTALLLLAALLLWLVGSRAGAGAPSRPWRVLSLVFLAIAADEAGGFHELLIDPLAAAFDLSGAFRFAWVVVGIAVVAVFAAAFLPFLLRLPPRTRRLFATAAALYVGGALGMEMVGASLFQEEGTPGRNMLPYMLAATVEELLEMVGVQVFIYALLRHLRETAPLLDLRIR